MVFDKSPAFTVIVALREDVEVFSVTLTVTVALPEPDDVPNLHHVWSLTLAQEVLEVMVNESFPSAAVNDKSFLFNWRTGSAPL